MIKMSCCKDTFFFLSSGINPNNSKVKIVLKAKGLANQCLVGHIRNSKRRCPRVCWGVIEDAYIAHLKQGIIIILVGSPPLSS